jgi:hypothetical protein
MALKEALLDTDLAARVDVKFNPLDISPAIISSHPETCEGLAHTEKNCNYIADGMNLCAQHSTQWQNFTTCAFKQGLKGDTTNPFAKKETFDQQLGECAKELSDYSADQLRACTYGEEADRLRAASKKKIAELFSDYGMKSPGLVWAAVDGKPVQDPTTEKGPDVSRGTWQQKLKKAVCEALPKDLPRPESCSKFVVV